MIVRLLKQIALAALLLLPVSALPAQQAAPSVPVVTGPAAVSMTEGYVLGPGDVVEVSVLGRDEFRPRVQVQTDGTIQLPYIGSFPAANKTILKLRDDVKAALKSGGYYADPVVNVSIATYASRYVIVLGEVGTPGLVPIDRAYRVSEILARAGGAKDSGAETLVLRRTSGEEINLVLSQIAIGNDSEDPFVNPGDKIFIPAAKTFYIYGQVSAPGTYRVDRDMNLRKALARGGGLTAMGSEKRVKVFREGKELRNFDPNAPILGGDVVVVGERFF